jgi:protease PrsW
MPLLLSAIVIAIPTYFYARMVRNIDRYEKEPAKYLVAAFLWGALPAVIVGVFLELVFALPVIAIFGDESTAANFVNTGIIAPVVEEVIKAAALGAIYLWRRREFDGWIDGIVYGSTVGFGFAYVENVMYLAGTGSMGEWATLFALRVLVLGFMHGFWTSLTGIGFGLARNRSSDLAKAALIALGLSAAILGHILHNASLTLAEASQGATLCVSGLTYLVLIVLMIGLSVLGGRRERSLMQTHLSDEVPDVITSDAYEVLCNPRSNTRNRLNLMPKQQRELFQLACELALKKRHLATHGDDGHTSAEIQRYRDALRVFNPLAPPTARAMPAAPVTSAPDPAAAPGPESPRA